MLEQFLNFFVHSVLSGVVFITCLYYSGWYHIGAHTSQVALATLAYIKPNKEK